MNMRPMERVSRGVCSLYGSLSLPSLPFSFSSPLFLLTELPQNGIREIFLLLKLLNY